MKRKNVEEFPDSTNLYLVNLARDVDEAQLHADFGKFGAVLSVRIMRDTTGATSGAYAGFVLFGSRAHATEAMYASRYLSLAHSPRCASHAL